MKVAPKVAPRVAPRTVLVVDDDATLRRALESVLVHMGYRVLSAGNPETAYSVLATEPADAVLLDVRLPTMSGLALYLALLHRHPALAGRIAIMTGDADASDVRPWLQVHRPIVFRKPFHFDQIAGWLDRAVRTGRRKAAGG